MGGIFKLIKNLFSGIFSFIGGIFGSKKSGYFMELDEAEAAKPAPTLKAEDAKSAVATVKATAKSTATAVAEGAKETTEAAAPKSVKAKSAVANPAKAEADAIAETNGSTNGAKPSPADTLNLPQPTVSFAPEYLVPKPTNSRRRPGANMGSFLEMAKTVKTPNN